MLVPMRGVSVYSIASIVVATITRGSTDCCQAEVDSTAAVLCVLSEGVQGIPASEVGRCFRFSEGLGRSLHSGHSSGCRARAWTLRSCHHGRAFRIARGSV
jgi:hypothetical protein